MKIKSQIDFFSGMLFIGFGIAFAWGSTSYKVGDAGHMGAGYLPLILGVLLILLGIAVTIQSLMLETGGEDNISDWAWKPLVCVLGANLAFGVLLCGLPSIKLPAMGLILAIYGLTIIASLASDRFKISEVFIMATVFAVGSYLCFVVLLKLQFLVWPAFVTS
jgi:hypothetical protein